MDGINTTRPGKKEKLYLLLAVAVILAAAYPLITRHKKDIADEQAKVQLRSMAVAMESYFLKENRYPADRSVLFRLGYRPQDGIEVEGPLPGKSGNLLSSWKARAWHKSGGKTFTYDSERKQGERITGR